jgi:hypothetical protein
MMPKNLISAYQEQGNRPKNHIFLASKRIRQDGEWSHAALQNYNCSFPLTVSRLQDKQGWLSSLSDNLVIYVHYFHAAYPSLGISPSKSNYRTTKTSELA